MTVPTSRTSPRSIFSTIPILVAAFRRLVTNPILLSQAIASVTGAVISFLGVSWMSHGEYATFALLNLASNTIFGFARVVVLQPALIQYRVDKLALTPPRYAIGVGLGGGMILVLLAILFGIHDPGQLIALGISMGLPIVQDWLRHRCLIVDKRWRTAVAETARLGLTFGVLAVATGVEVGYYQAFANFCCLIAVIVQLGHHARTPRWTPFRSYRRPAALQSIDYAVGTLNSIIPMFMLGHLGGGVAIGGFRLAQTMMGPLNLVFSASTTTLLADGATRASHTADVALLRAGKRLARALALLGAAVVALAVVLVVVLHLEFSGVSHSALLVGLVGVGLVAITSGWSGIHTILLRMLGENRRVTIGRAFVVGLTWIGFAAGYAEAGVDGSVIVGFAVSAVMYPVGFILPARPVYARIMREQQQLE
ncbi:hypothetical protein DEI81_13790 [Curtobacterium sp. MCBD17_013]|nr:hypothetical protein DEI81_13790 [Curtobacterium sp. MCBD17_013]